MTRDVLQQRPSFHHLTTSKLFLNSFNSIDKKLNQKKNPTWIRSYNFMSLLNLPAAMEIYGPLVNLWEGKLMGEAIIKHCKSELEYGLRGNWAVNVLKNHYRKRALKRLTEEDINEDDPELECDEEELTQTKKGRCAFKRYETFFDVKGAFSSGAPFSAVCWSDKDGDIGRGIERTYGVVYGKKREHVRVMIRVPWTDITKNGMVYWRWRLTDDSLDYYKPLAQCERVLPIVLLPLLQSEKKDYYTVVSSEWEQLVFH